jgi:hypothetical protein
MQNNEYELLSPKMCVQIHNLNLYRHCLNIFKHIDRRLILKDINLTIKMDFIMYDKFSIN